MSRRKDASVLSLCDRKPWTAEGASAGAKIAMPDFETVIRSLMTQSETKLREPTE